MRLARKARDITVGEVVRHMEPDLHLVECFRADQQCTISPVCKLAGVMDEALKGFLAVLDRYTLADLIERPRPLSQLLGVELPAGRTRAAER